MQAICISVVLHVLWSESRSVVSDSLRPHGRYSPWNSQGQNTGVGSLSLLQGIFPNQESNRGLLHCRWILYSLSCQGSPFYTRVHPKNDVVIVSCEQPRDSAIHMHPFSAQPPPIQAATEVPVLCSGPGWLSIQNIAVWVYRLLCGRVFSTADYWRGVPVYNHMHFAWKDSSFFWWLALWRGHDTGGRGHHHCARPHVTHNKRRLGRGEEKLLSGFRALPIQVFIHEIFIMCVAYSIID